MSLLTTLKNFFKNLFKKKTVTPAPVAPTVPVVSPTPVPPPAAVNPPAPVQVPPADPASYLPAGVLAIDERGFAKFKAIEDQRASNPAWKDAVAWYACEGLPPSFNVQSNITQAKALLFIGGISLDKYDMSDTYLASEMTPNPTGFGYKIGKQYDDALAFIGDNFDGQGNKIYTGFRPENADSFVANCNAQKSYPVIAFSTTGKVI